MVAVLKIFSNHFLEREIWIWLKFHWSLLLRVDMTISVHCFREWLGTNRQPMMTLLNGGYLSDQASRNSFITTWNKPSLNNTWISKHFIITWKMFVNKMCGIDFLRQRSFYMASTPLTPNRCETTYWQNTFLRRSGATPCKRVKVLPCPKKITHGMLLRIMRFLEQHPIFEIITIQWADFGHWPDMHDIPDYIVTSSLIGGVHTQNDPCNTWCAVVVRDSY